MMKKEGFDMEKEAKKMYTVALNGCDDYTEFDMILSSSEAELLKKVSKLSEETSTYGCMPTMDLTLKDK